MKQIPGFVAAALILGATLTAASAQNRNSQTLPPAPSPYKWCLEEQAGSDSGGSLPWLCRFKTLEQCKASRTSPSDRCEPNNTGQRS
jgi:hypothetical protein